MCKLHKALYGLKQAPRAWFERLASNLMQHGFSPSKCDPSLFLRITNSSVTYALVYVDDILLTRLSPQFVSLLKSKLNSEFALKDLGLLHYFLGVEVNKLPNGSLHFSQKKYITDLSQKVGNELCKIHANSHDSHFQTQ